MTDQAQQAAVGAAMATAQAAQTDAQAKATVVLPKDQKPPALSQDLRQAAGKVTDSADQDLARTHVEQQLRAEGLQFPVHNPVDRAPVRASRTNADAPDVTR